MQIDTQGANMRPTPFNYRPPVESRIAAKRQPGVLSRDNLVRLVAGMVD